MRVRHEVVLMAEVVVPLTIRDLTREERLGYVAFGSKPESWDVDAEDGSTVCYETVCTLMCKELP
jgi:hypothetical protein